MAGQRSRGGRSGYRLEAEPSQRREYGARCDVLLQLQPTTAEIYLAVRASSLQARLATFAALSPFDGQI